MTSSMGAPVPIPADPRASETYADRARTQGPGVEADARVLLGRVRRSKATAWDKPGRFVDEAERMARGLPGAHLPWFWDTVVGDDTTRIPRLLALLGEHGPLPVTDAAVDLFRWRTGVPRPVAALVLDGIVGSGGQAADLKLCRAKPYRADRFTATLYLDLLRKLGPTGRLAVLSAALPEDPADLWAPGGTTAVAERMATAWSDLLGVTPYADDGSHAAVLAEDHGLPGSWATALLTGCPAEPLDADGTRAAATAVTWALAERPVGDPAAEGARALIDLLTGAPAELRTTLRALADRSLTTPVPPGQYEANPLFSVPDLVDEVASALGVGRDAAALHLQPYALDRPADRTVRRWNGWTPGPPPCRPRGTHRREGAPPRAR
ncbi:hypothetical protein [Streptomyces sp. NPDC057238]|uniref:hypothetical protein n=1 Tax=Streptomyces sp. NPDC057238 TaxID=3346060 RepID=UPI00362DC544